MAGPPQIEPAPGRLESLDALRGFDMLWIVGADAVGSSLRALNGGAVSGALGTQLEHSKWEGMHAYDLIFPLFVFMIGVALTFSLDRIVADSGQGAAVRRVFRRGLLLYLLGLVYYGGISGGLEHVRLMGVLQRLAISYVGASLLYLYFRPRALGLVWAGILVGYWALLRFVPVPGFGPGDLAEGHNLADWIDARWLPLWKWNGDHDPEGILSSFPAVATCLMGVFAGLALRRGGPASAQKAGRLALAGVVSLVAGRLWGLEFPIIKRIWTSSFVLVAGGWSLLLLAAFYHVIEVRGRRAWCRPFVWIGANALTIYLISRFVDFGELSKYLLGGEIAAGLDRLWAGLSGVVLAATGIALCTLLCRFLYARRIFLRL